MCPTALDRIKLILCLVTHALVASTSLAGAAERAAPCEQCAVWNEPQQPFRLYGNSYYVGPHGLASILITSDQGHVLIDGALPESAALIAANVRALGFRVEEIRVILNTHPHFDHAGGIAELQRLTGAKVYASRWSARVFSVGSAADDPQAGALEPIAKVARVSELKDGEIVKVGPLSLRARFTPGHTGGGTSWTWRSCEGQRCVDIVYADSLTPVSADTFRFTGKKTLLEQFEASYATLAALPCDLLVTPHPEASGLWERLERRETQGVREALLDPAACDAYVAASRQRLAERLAREGAE